MLWHLKAHHWRPGGVLPLQLHPSHYVSHSFDLNSTNDLSSFLHFHAIFGFSVVVHALSLAWNVLSFLLSILTPHPTPQNHHLTLPHPCMLSSGISPSTKLFGPPFPSTAELEAPLPARVMPVTCSSKHSLDILYDQVIIGLFPCESVTFLREIVVSFLAVTSEPGKVPDSW